MTTPNEPSSKAGFGLLCREGSVSLVGLQQTASPCRVQSIPAFQKEVQWELCWLATGSLA